MTVIEAEDQMQASEPPVNSEISQPLKPINVLILDSTPLLLNTPSLSTLLAQSTSLLSTQSVIAEIRDADARLRVDTLYSPFLELRTPKPESIKIVRDFARRTGDLAVLSRTDVEVLGLAYEVECEMNGGDWRLRRVPGQRRVNGAPPEKKPEEKEEQVDANVDATEESLEGLATRLDETTLETSQPPREWSLSEPTKLHSGVPSMSIEDKPIPILTQEGSYSSSDSEGWITPSNIKKHQIQNKISKTSTSRPPSTMQVATMTGDFAMQNVLLQMNLNLLSTATCTRITHLKQTILRCHACFTTTKQMDKQFCERCGKPTLTRVSYSTNANGETKVHLKRNMQWNNKGNVFSIPKPTAGTANHKWVGPRHGGGGKGGWGNDLILAEDQKEFVRARQSQGRERAKDLMDEDYLPGILTGERAAGGGRARVGAGRTVNSRKR